MIAVVVAQEGHKGRTAFEGDGGCQWGDHGVPRGKYHGVMSRRAWRTESHMVVHTSGQHTSWRALRVAYLSCAPVHVRAPAQRLSYADAGYTSRLTALLSWVT